VRIAVSGTHAIGKSTLAAALGERLPHHIIVPEPYEVLTERGYEFAHPPGVDDFVVQLKQSLITLRRRSPNLIFDRCPLDFLGYISASSGASRFDLEAWRGLIMHAMAKLDLSFVPPILCSAGPFFYRCASDPGGNERHFASRLSAVPRWTRHRPRVCRRVV
jgi:hypothetical protein